MSPTFEYIVRICGLFASVALFIFAIRNGINILVNNFSYIRKDVDDIKKKSDEVDRILTAHSIELAVVKQQQLNCEKCTEHIKTQIEDLRRAE